MITRDDALAILFEYTQSDSLRNHALAVEAAMRAYAARYGEDELEWGITGLLHDFDYERYPDADQHPSVGTHILAEKGIPEPIRRAILSHAEHTGIARVSLMEKTLFACDELCGFLMAVAYVRPDRKMESVQVRSVRKKMKDKAFARAVSREDILRGAQELGIDFDVHVAFVLDALRSIHDQLGV